MFCASRNVVYVLFIHVLMYLYITKDNFVNFTMNQINSLSKAESQR